MILVIPERWTGRHEIILVFVKCVGISFGGILIHTVLGTTYDDFFENVVPAT